MPLPGSERASMSPRPRCFKPLHPVKVFHQVSRQTDPMVTQIPISTLTPSTVNPTNHTFQTTYMEPMSGFEPLTC